MEHSQTNGNMVSGEDFPNKINPIAIWRLGGFLSHRATPSYHPFRTTGFSIKSTNFGIFHDKNQAAIKGYPHDELETPIIHFRLLDWYIFPFYTKHFWIFQPQHVGMFHEYFFRQMIIPFPDVGYFSVSKTWALAGGAAIFHGQVLALCIHQLQSSPTDEALEQDQEQLRDQSLGENFGKNHGKNHGKHHGCFHGRWG